LSNNKYITPEPKLEKIWIMVNPEFFAYLTKRKFGKSWHSWASKALYNQLVADGDLIPFEEEYDGEPVPPPEDETPYMGEMPEPEEGTVFLNDDEVKKMVAAEPESKVSDDFDEARALRLHEARTRLVYDPTKRRRMKSDAGKVVAEGGIKEK
jgi:hypothetical protein